MPETRMDRKLFARKKPRKRARPFSLLSALATLAFLPVAFTIAMQITGNPAGLSFTLPAREVAAAAESVGGGFTN
ncbi:hypothetical protein HY418_03035 [Candidatus Kaiserbacteria bacterium]|nr:hypothetical protein [Candidatus Kaiserbacteria bacterium]